MQRVRGARTTVALGASNALPDAHTPVVTGRRKSEGN